MDPDTLQLLPTQARALLGALQSPGWATTMDDIGDGTDAIKALRGVAEIGDDTGAQSVSLDKYQRAACVKALSEAITKRAWLGAGDAALALCEAVGMQRSKRDAPQS